MKPTEASKQIILTALSSYYNLYPQIKDIKFHPNNLGGYTIVLFSGKTIPGYEYNIFRGNAVLFSKYLNTFASC